MQRQLLKHIEENQSEWDLYLDSVLFAYRVSKQSSTKYAPFYLMYGRQAKLPLQFSGKSVYLYKSYYYNYLDNVSSGEESLADDFSTSLGDHDIDGKYMITFIHLA